MSDRPNRREFLKCSAAALSAAAFRQSAQPAAGAAAATTAHPMPQNYEKGMPTGKLGRLSVSRLFLGCNQVSGYAHARDLRYVPKLMREYQTDERVLVDESPRLPVMTTVCAASQRTGLRKPG